MGCTHLRPRDEIQSGANADKRYVGQEALPVIGKQLLLGCAKGDETEIGSLVADCFDAAARILG